MQKYAYNDVFSHRKRVHKHESSPSIKIKNLKFPSVSGYGNACVIASPIWSTNCEWEWELMCSNLVNSCFSWEFRCIRLIYAKQYWILLLYFSVNCEAGKGGNAAGNGCEDCGAGTYSDDTDATSCKTCPVNTYSSGGSNTICTECDGSKTSPAGSLSADDCTREYQWF